MNKVILIGRLTRDPELRYIQSGIAVCNLMLAVDRAYSNGSEKEADFIPVVVWQKLAENVAKYMSKGRQIAVEGRMQVSSYEKDGERRYKTEVVANSIQFLGSKPQGGADARPDQGETVAYSQDEIDAIFGPSDQELPF